MSESRIKTYHNYNEPTPGYVYQDRNWVFEHETELLEKYGRCYIVPYRQQVLGKGDSYDEAIADAERNLPSEIAQIEALVIWIGPHHRIARIPRAAS
jgi:hypothetical protein